MRRRQPSAEFRGIDARIHVEQDASWRSAAVHAIDPSTRKIGERGEVFLGCKPARFEAAHLAWRRRARQCGPASDDPAHRRIMAQTLSVIYVFVAGEASKDGLPEPSASSKGYDRRRAGRRYQDARRSSLSAGTT
jgi:hypothetical protein